MEKPPLAKCVELGLAILNKYPNPTISVEIDVIYAGTDDECVPTNEETLELAKLGWFVSTQYFCWCIYV